VFDSLNDHFKTGLAERLKKNVEDFQSAYGNDLRLRCQTFTKG